jgi:TrwC relaxase
VGPNQLVILSLGVRFAERPGTDPSKRPIREIVGVDPRLNTRWSTRRAHIETRRGELAIRFQDDHGRPPTPERRCSVVACRGTRHIRADQLLVPMCSDT